MDVLSAIFLGMIQGLTEFLPVSSSGHLVLAEHFLHLNLEGDEATALNVLLHLGSLLAIFVVFGRDIARLLAPVIDWKTIALLVYVSIPAAIVGFTLKLSGAANVVMVPWVAAPCLLVTSLLLFLAERPRTERVELRTAAGSDWRRAGIIGVAQAIAILPGVSRSGSTVCTALMLGWTRPDALRLSFLMGAIAISGAGLLEARHMAQIPALPGAAAFISSVGFSLIGLLMLKFVLARRKLRWFAVYTAIVGTAALCGLAFG